MRAALTWLKGPWTETKGVLCAAWKGLIAATVVLFWLNYAMSVWPMQGCGKGEVSMMAAGDWYCMRAALNTNYRTVKLFRAATPVVKKH